MKLTVERSQVLDRSIIRFSAKFLLEVSPEEAEKIMKYVRKDMVLGRVEPICPGALIDRYIAGTAVYQSENIISMLSVEEQVKEDVEKLASIIDVASSYSGTAELISTA